MKAVLVVNQHAGGLDGVGHDALRREFRDAGFDVETRFANGTEIVEQLRAAVVERPDALFVGGGDGTISTAAGLVADSGIRLGVLPLGTLNHFACDLGTPKNWRETVAAFAHAREASVDVAEVNGRIFINNCSIGSYPEAVRKREALRRRKGAGKWTAMCIATISVLRRLRRLRVNIELPQTTLQLRTPFILVANNRYSGHLFNECLRPRLDEARLVIYTTRARQRLTLLHLAWQSLTRTIDAVDGLEQHEAMEATISSPIGAPLPLAIDGELADLRPPLQFRIRPKALRLFAPPPSTSG